MDSESDMVRIYCSGFCDKFGEIVNSHRRPVKTLLISLVTAKYQVKRHVNDVKIKPLQITNKAYNHHNLN